eukprot:3514838-Rhodomonas_salina.1
MYGHEREHLSWGYGASRSTDPAWYGALKKRKVHFVSTATAGARGGGVAFCVRAGITGPSIKSASITLPVYAGNNADGRRDWRVDAPVTDSAFHLAEKSQHWRGIK